MSLMPISSKALQGAPGSAATHSLTAAGVRVPARVIGGLLLHPQPLALSLYTLPCCRLPQLGPPPLRATLGLEVIAMHGC